MIVCIIALQFVAPTVVYAEPPASGDKSAETVAPSIPKISTLPGPTPETELKDVNKYLNFNLLPNIARVVTGLAATASVIFIIFGSIQFLTAYGNEEKLGNAKKTVTFAIIGLFISLLSFAIVQLIFSTGYNIMLVKS